MNVNFQPFSQSIRWDAHCCPPFKVGSDLSFLNRYKNLGINYVSLNVGYDLVTQIETLNLINYFQKWIEENCENYMLIKNVEQLHQCIVEKKLGIGFDFEGCNVLNNNLEMVSYFYSLGVKQLAFVYNINNSSGGGCLDKDSGLSHFGHQLVKECNQVGMVIDCSHVGYQSSMEIIESSESPVIFSHSNPEKLVNHPRNISDDQIVFCAQKGGVIGINGIGIFLGNNDIRTERIVEHIDYVVQLVGAKHVGIGLDCVFNIDEIKNCVANNPSVFPANLGFDNVAIAQPEQFSEISGLLSLRGYSEHDIDNILGNNFYRIAQSVWR